jgi:hypothetical protein
VNERPEHRATWQAEHVVRTLWMAGRGLKSWQRVLGGHNPHRASYLAVFVPELPDARIGAHELRLWRRDLESFLAELSPAEREALNAHLNTARWNMLFRWRPVRGRFERANVPEQVCELAHRLRRVCKEVRNVSEAI